MHTIFVGVGISIVYGIVAAVIVYSAHGPTHARLFLEAYVRSFNTLLSTGLIIGTAWIVFRSQPLIPQIIERAFADNPELWTTDYLLYRKRFNSIPRSLTLSSVYIVVGFAIFSYCRFPLSDPGDLLMIIPACVQYGLGVYVGRKLCYAGMMLHSLLTISINRNLFRARELDDINAYVHIASTLTIIFVYVHVRSYYSGPFLFDSPFGVSVRSLLVLPAFIATPVLLIFNFYSRAVLRQLYSKSIDLEVAKLQEALQNEDLTLFEKKSYLIEVDKMERDELRYSLQLTLGDLPIGLTIAIMILEPLVGS